jgi:hypothetical protein
MGVIYLPEPATLHWTELAEQLRRLIATRGLTHTVVTDVAPPVDDPSASLATTDPRYECDWLVVPASKLNPAMISSLRPRRVLVAHAGIPSALALGPYPPPVFNVRTKKDRAELLACLLAYRFVSKWKGSGMHWLFFKWHDG